MALRRATKDAWRRTREQVCLLANSFAQICKGFVMRKFTPWLAVIAILVLLAVVNSPHASSRALASRAAAFTNTPPSTHQVVYKVATSRDVAECYGFDTTYQMPSGTAQKTVNICDGSHRTVVDQRTGSRGD